MRAFTVFIIAIAALFSGCSYNTGYYGANFRPVPGSVKLGKIPIENVGIETFESKKSFQIRAKSLMGQGYRPVGASEFNAALTTDFFARGLAANVGGDLVLVGKEHLGKDVGSRFVVGSYTPGHVVSARTRSYGNVYGAGLGAAGATYSGTSNTDVYIPPKRTYVRENFLYESFYHIALVLASPKRLEVATRR